MENGSFEYDLVLPIPEGQDVSKEELSVVYIEDKKDLKELEQNVVTDVTEDKDVKVDVDEDRITVENLDHFTIFIPMCQCSKIKICHRTNSHSNPYVEIELNKSGVSFYGHDGHNGPIWFSGIDEEWGDIIPPFVDYFGRHYEGKNWPEGEAILKNNCTVPGSITIIKDAQPDDSQGFEFEGSTQEGTSKFTLVDDGSQGDNSKTFSSLPKNTYTIVENEMDGWKLTDISCEGGEKIKEYLSKGKVKVKLGEGENVVCTFTNEKEEAILTLVKEVKQNHGGTHPATAWTLSANGPTLISGETGSTDVTDAMVEPGIYKLSELGPNGYNASTWDCGDTKVSSGKVALENGDDVTCTIINNDIPSDLTVCKFNDATGDGKYDDGDLLLGGWMMTLRDDDGKIIGKKTTQGMNECIVNSGCVTFKGLSAGDYTVTETQQTGWINTNATDLTQPVILGLDNSQTIYFGNQQLSTIIVHKDVVGPNDEDITDTTNNFAVTLDGTDEKMITDGETVTYNGIVAGEEQNPNVYTIDESIIPFGYKLDSITPDSDANTPGAQVTVVPGETTEVLVVNRQQLYCGDGIVTGDEECDGDAGVGEGEFCTSQCKLVPVYDGEHDCPEGTTKVHVDTITLDSHSGNVETLSFVNGISYLLEASGTYQYASSSQRKADAAYGTTDNFSTWRQDIGIWGTNRGVTSILGDLGRGMGVVEWDDDENINSSHVYAMLVEPQSNMIADFVIGDWYSDWYGSHCDDQSCLGDNDGSLDVDLYECRANENIDGYKYDYVTGAPIENWPIELCRFDGNNVANACTQIATTTTDSNGYYEFTDLPVGLYKVTEGTMSGYTQMAPTSYIVDLTGDTMKADGNMIANGGFEAPVVGGSWNHYAQGVTGLAWDVEWVGNTVMYDGYSRPEPARAEIQKSVGGWGDFEGNQYAELDTDWGVANGEPANVVLSQDIQTCDGGEYELHYAWSPRPRVNNNQMNVSWGIGTDAHSANGGSDTIWTSETQTFTAIANETTISFTENGPENSLGMFLDGVEVVQTNTCPRGSVDFYNRKDIPDVRRGSITACKFEDTDKDGQQGDGEEMIAGWEMTLGNKTQTTDEKGCTTFDELPLGKYTVTEEDRNGWEVTTGSLSQDVTLGAAVKDYHKTVTFGNWYESSDVKVCKKDEAGNELAGWEMILSSVVDGPTNINVANGSGTDSTDLEAGQYLVKVSGTYKYGNSAMIADAGYSYRPMNIPSGCDCWFSGFDLPSSSNGLMAWINGDPIDWGDYNSSHEYSYVYDHAGGVMNFSLYDSYYGDNVNNGDFQFEIYKIKYQGITDGDDGCVEFNDVPWGDYELDEIMHDGWEYVSGGGSITVPSDSNTFTFVNKELLGDLQICKFEDNNADGVKNDGEEYIAWEVGVDGQNPVARGDDGCYTWHDLPAGDYTIFEVEQDGWTMTTNNNNSTHAVVDDEMTTVEFGNYELGKIRAIKYEDTNGNGKRDSGEPRLNGWEMTLTDEHGATTVGTTGDNGNGKVIFDNLAVGTYTVCETMQAGWTSTEPHNGSLCRTINVKAGTSRVAKFGNYELGYIVAIKYEDLNANGVPDYSSGEPRLNDWEMTLFDEDGNEIDTGMTGANGTGRVEFHNLPIGTYTVCETMQDGWVNTEPSDNVCRHARVRAGKKTVARFGNVQLGSIHGVKWHDHNMNGDRDGSEEFLSGWTIFLDENADGILDSNEQSTVTSSELGNYGEYLFEDLYPGEYRVCEVIQSGWEQTYPLEPNCHTVVLPEDDNACGCNDNCWLDWDCDDWFDCDCECSCNEYDFGNVELGEVVVTKWHDVNGDGVKDVDEEVLEGWDMNLKMEGDAGYNETQTTLTDGTTTFVDLRPTVDSPYLLSETLQDYWRQTGIYCEEQPVDDNDDVCEGDCLFDAVGWNFVSMEDVINGDLSEGSINFDLAPGETKHCYVGNQFITPDLAVTKTNNEYENGPDKPGDIVKYTLTVHTDATGGPIVDATVMDVPPEQFKYVSGSYSVSSNVNPALSIPEPVYSSLGTWMLGDMVPGEVITLVYDAKIGDNAQTGMYLDVAFANGKDVMGTGITASSAPSDFIVAEGIVNDTFVGTQIEIEADEQETVAVGVEVDEDVETTKKKKDVYVNLPATGAEEGWIKFAMVALFAGVLLLLSGGVMRMRRSKVSQSIKSIAFLTVMSIALAMAGSVSAAAGDLVVRADEPVETSNTTFSFGYVVLDAQSRGVDVECLVQKPSSSTFETFKTVAHSGTGGSGDCGITDDVLSEQGTYKLKVQATTGGDVSESEMYEVAYNTTTPGKPKWIEKDKEGDCRYDVEFKTADDGQTVRVELYHSRDREFTVDENSRWATVTVGPNEKMTVTDHLDETSVCNKKHWYAVRAFDEAGNASSVRVEEEEIEETKTVENVIIVESSTSSSTTTSSTGSTGSSDVTTDGETSTDADSSGETGEEGTNTQIDESADAESYGETSDGEVAGEATEEETIWGLTSSKWLGALLVTLGIIGIVYAVRARNDKTSGKQNS